MVELKSGLFVELTAKVVAACVSNNAVRSTDLPELIEQVHAAFVGVNKEIDETAAVEPKPEPAVHPRKSVTPDYIICLEDGKKFKTLKRHLMVSFGFTPEQYRKRWDLDPDYPMVASNYAATRSQLAYKMGLGRQPKAGG